MDLKQLYDKLLSEGCNRFYIDGIGGPQSDDLECLGENNGNWEIYYIERGQKSKPIFSTADINQAIERYRDHVLKIEHWHLVAFTRSAEVVRFYKSELQKLGISTIQNDIPDYKVGGDRVFRLFVVNKDIFIANQKLETVPYFDVDLKR